MGVSLPVSPSDTPRAVRGALPVLADAAHAAPPAAPFDPPETPAPAPLPASPVDVVAAAVRATFADFSALIDAGDFGGAAAFYADEGAAGEGHPSWAGVEGRVTCGDRGSLALPCRARRHPSRQRDQARRPARSLSAAQRGAGRGRRDELCPTRKRQPALVRAIVAVIAPAKA